VSESPAILLEAVREVAEAASRTAIRYFQRPLDVEQKPDGSEVTDADRAAERTARDWLEVRFPHDTVVGEEFGTIVRDGARRWYIDPIDGTKTFVRGVPFWGAMVAVEEHGVVMAGAISCPAAGESVAAALGEGCWHNGRRARVSDVASLADAAILVTDARFVSHPARAERWASLASRVALARTWGDCYGYVLVATGRAELMADDRLSPWDAAPLGPIIGEAGGVFTDWRGRPDAPSRDGLATNANLAVAFRRALDIPVGSETADRRFD
jgi:histidinol phosphatase-like enzyme (inositol monophosphatase family)